MSYNVKLEIFEGPLDLLLHLIKKNEVDIYDIPISVITEEYIGYIDMMKEMNLDFAGEFLLMAATLVHIKSKMLLPIDAPAEEDEAEGVDPRAELVRRLVAYRMYKEAAADLGARHMLGRDVFTRGASAAAAPPEEDALMNLSVFDLMEALKDVLKKAPKDAVIDISADRFTIADKIHHILELLRIRKSSTFTALFPLGARRGEIIVTFLAILELAKLVLIRIHQTDDGVIRVTTAEAQRPDEGHFPEAKDADAKNGVGSDG